MPHVFSIERTQGAYHPQADRPDKTAVHRLSMLACTRSAIWLICRRVEAP
jgi:hypothetical protein